MKLYSEDRSDREKLNEIMGWHKGTNGLFVNSSEAKHIIANEIERLRRELEWFADPDNYVGDHDEDGYHSAPIANGFKRAQRALEGTES